MQGIPTYEKHDDIPTMWAGLLHSLKFAFQAQPLLLVVSFVMTIGSLVPESLAALGIRNLIYGVVQHDDTAIMQSAIFLALCGVEDPAVVLLVVGLVLAMLALALYVRDGLQPST